MALSIIDPKDPPTPRPLSRLRRTVLDVVELYGGNEGMTGLEIIAEVKQRRWWAGVGNVYPAIYRLVETGHLMHIRDADAPGQKHRYRRRD